MLSDNIFELVDGSTLHLDLYPNSTLDGPGGHVSTSPHDGSSTDTAPELFFTVDPQTDILSLHVREALDDQAGSRHHYTVDLGPQEEVENAWVQITQDHVQVQWKRWSHNAGTERKRFVLFSLIPLQSHVGFWNAGAPRLFCRYNGLLSGLEGSGYDDLHFRYGDSSSSGGSEGDDETDTRATTDSGPATAETTSTGETTQEPAAL